MSLGGFSYPLAGLAGLVAGAVNAMAGGGTLVSFPVLVALGVPSLRANVTNIIALTPAQAAGTAVQRHDLSGEGRALRRRALVAAAGGVGGSAVLVVTSQATFRAVVPYLIVGSCVVLLAQGRLRALTDLAAPGGIWRRYSELAGLFCASVYGGYFGAGLGIVLLGLLGLFSDAPLVRLNAVKQALSFVVSLAASIFLIATARVAWGFVAVLAPAAVLGGVGGSHLVRLVHPRILRVLVVLVGLAVAVRYWA